MSEFVTNQMDQLNLSDADKVILTNVFGKIPLGFQKLLFNRFSTLFTKDEKKARGYISYLIDDTKGKELNRSDTDIWVEANKKASECAGMDFETALLFCSVFDIDVPKITKVISKEGIHKRLISTRWWNRKLTSQHYRKVEVFAIRHGLVHKKASKYISSVSFSNKIKKNNKNINMLKNTNIYSTDGQKISLFDAYKSGVSNPRIRLAELMNKIRNLELLAQLQEKDCLFITVTAPSKYHAFNRWGKLNSKFKGSTPRSTHQHMMTIFNKALTAIRQANVVVYGIRVTEPHHDGTPHYHALFWGFKKELEIANRILSRYFCKEEAKELLNLKDKSARYKSIWIDPELGSATAYVIKYVSKNIPGALKKEQNSSDLKIDINDTGERVAVWAGIHGIRLFNLFGKEAKGATVWRELRKIEVDTVTQCATVNLLKAFARENNWLAFSLLKEDLKPLYLDAGLNAYNEPLKKLTGIFNTDSEVKINTRMRQWSRTESEEYLIALAEANEYLFDESFDLSGEESFDFSFDEGFTEPFENFDEGFTEPSNFLTESFDADLVLEERF